MLEGPAVLVSGPDCFSRVHTQSVYVYVCVWDFL